MTVYFKELISILKTFRELDIARFKLDKPVSLEKVFVLYKRSNLASFLSFIGNGTVTKYLESWGAQVLSLSRTKQVKGPDYCHQGSSRAGIETGNQLRA